MPNELGAAVDAEVKRAEADFQGVRAKAIGVLTVAGGIVSIVTGFLAVAAGSHKDILPAHATWVVALAVSLFVAATILALMINLPADVWAVDVGDLRDKVENEWESVGWDQEVAKFSVDYIDDLRKSNKHAMNLLALAIGAEIAGITVTGALAVLVVAHMP